MPPQAWLTLTVVIGMLLALLRNLPTDVVLVAALLVLQTAALWVSGLPGPEALWGGFANEAVLTVGVLYIVASGISHTAALESLSRTVFAGARGERSAQARLMGMSACLSTVLNNTPIVAMFLPVVRDLSRRTGIAASKLYIPLSYATILGGLCTLIGTSTNMILYGLARADGDPRTDLSLFDPAWVGVPCALAGMAFLMLTTRWLLPDRAPLVSAAADPREYQTELELLADSSLVGRTIEAAGLRGLPGVYLSQIERGGRILPAVGSTEVLCGGDRLSFVGALESVRDLTRMRGLITPDQQTRKLATPELERCWIEAVVAPQCPLVGRSIREGRFRSVYEAAVIAVARSGARLEGKLGDIVLEAGDQLLLEAHPRWYERMRDSRDFHLVSRLEDSTPPGHEKAPLALAILVAMVLVAGLEWLSMLHAGLLASTLMLLTGCTSIARARAAIDWQVLIAIAAGIGLGSAVQKSGLAFEITGLVGGNSPMVALLTLYAVTMLLTELLSNNATAALMFPIGMASAHSLGVSPMPFLMAIMVAASCGFATPIGYQTNLMVFAPGGYRFADFIRAGGLLDLVVMLVALAVIPLVWNF
jgi:di/tricarboxylate transporter